MEFEELVKECLNGNSVARKQLYEQFARQMYTVCMRYARSKEDADDIFNQSFLNIYEKLYQLKNPKALAGWVKSACVNTSLEYARKNYKVQDITESINEEKDWDTAMNQAVSKMALADLTRLIQQLPEQYKRVFNLYIVDGYSHKEIAEKLEISIGTSKSNLHDARKLLKTKIIASGLIE